MYSFLLYDGSKANINTYVRVVTFAFTWGYLITFALEIVAVSRESKPVMTPYLYHKGLVSWHHGCKTTCLTAAALQCCELVRAQRVHVGVVHHSMLTVFQGVDCNDEVEVMGADVFMAVLVYLHAYDMMNG